MSCSQSKYYDELTDYKRLCYLLNEKPRIDRFGSICLDYNHFEKLKLDKKIEFKNYMYKLKVRK